MSYEGKSSADLIRQARRSLASEDLVRQAREQLDIVEPTAELERHIGTVETGPTRDTVANILRQVQRTPVRETATEDEEQRAQAPPPPIIRPRRRHETPPANGRMIEVGDRLPTQTEDTKKPPRVRRLVGIGAAIFIIVSFAGDYFENQAAENTITEPVVDAGVEEAIVVPLDDVQAGMCIQQPTQETFFDVEAVPCTTPHDLEIIGNVLLFGTDYPGDEAIYDDAFEMCLSLFEPYVGTSYDTSIWWLNAFTPTAEGWEEGDQRATCMVFQYTGDNEILRVTTSARGDGR